MHLQIRDHVCDTCGTAFQQASHLKVHIRCHTNEKPFKCEHCGKAFSQQATLQTHMDVHETVATRKERKRRAAEEKSKLDETAKEALKAVKEERFARRQKRRIS